MGNTKKRIRNFRTGNTNITLLSRGLIVKERLNQVKRESVCVCGVFVLDSEWEVLLCLTLHVCSEWADLCCCACIVQFVR